MSLQSCKRIELCHSQLPPCSVQTYPRDNSILFIGTYKLEDNGDKHGSIDIYKQEGTLKLLNQFFTSAILDLKIKDTTIASCHADGSVILWNFEESELSLSKLKKIDVFDATATSINFSPFQNIMIATATDGQVCSIEIESGDLNYFNSSHELECWISEFGQLGGLSNVVFTGGDDSKLIAFDLRTNDPIWSTGMRHHDAGVVSILAPSQEWNLQNSNQLWTGSYDDSLRIFDLRVMDKKNPSLIQGYIPKVQQQENLGGGVWRLIPSPQANDNRVLVCCMYDGARIVDVQEESFVVTKYFKQDHESMCYGGDWGSDSKSITTCSFYDRVIQTWDPNTST